MKTILACLQLFPTILSAVQSLEGAIPLPNSGKQKLDLLVGIVKTAYDTEETIRQEVPWSKLVTLITSAAGSIVTTFNNLGLFNHKSQTPAQ